MGGERKESEEKERGREREERGREREGQRREKLLAPDVGRKRGERETEDINGGKYALVKGGVHYLLKNHKQLTMGFK